MQSKISFFHKGLSRNLMHRCWPVWIAYLALILFQFPVAVNSNIQTWRGIDAEFSNFVTQQILNSACVAPQISFFACIVVVTAVFGYLCNSRTCGMIHSYPVRRETVFCTFALTGLVPMLLADCLTALLAQVLFGNIASDGLILLWLRMAVMGNVAFYGFAVFCAMLTGSLFILPLVYLVLNFTAVVVENALHSLLGTFLYGYSPTSQSLSALSPGQIVLFRLVVAYTGENPEKGTSAYSITNLSSLTIYCIAGVVSLVFALLLYRKRRMEAAGDTVAIPVLKPVFKYCMAFGTALVLASVVTGEFFDQTLHSGPAAILATALLLIGAFIGYFAAEVLIQRTMHVFSSHWKGLLVAWAILLVFSICCEKDILGYETRLPDPSEVESVDLSTYGSSVMKDAQNIADAVALHRTIIDHKAEQEKKLDTTYGTQVNFEYLLKNGKTLHRTYRLASGSEEYESRGDLYQVQELLNRPEAILARNQSNVEVIPENISRGFVYTDVYEDQYDYHRQNEVVITADQAYDLYCNAILPDMEEGTIGRNYLFEEADEQHSDTSVSIDLSGRPEGTAPGKIPYYYSSRVFYSLYFSVEMDSAHTVTWLKENLDLDVKQLPLNEQRMMK